MSLYDKLTSNYHLYLNNNKHKEDITIKGNINYNGLKLSEYLKQPQQGISNTNLTPIPSREMFMVKRDKETKQYRNCLKNVVTMRRIEYNNYYRSVNNNKTKRSCKYVDKYSKSTYYMNLIITVQKLWKGIFNKKNKAAVIIQSNFKRFVIYKHFRYVYNSMKIYEHMVFIIQKVLFLNLLRLRKINSKHIDLNKYEHISKLHYNNKQLVYLQKYIKHYLITKHCKQVYNKSKCVCIKTINNFNLTHIIKLQRNIIQYLKRKHSMKPRLSGYFGIKQYRPISKIILLQNFIRFTLCKKKIKPLIIKDTFKYNYLFTKVPLLPNRITSPIDTSNTYVLNKQRYQAIHKQNIKLKVKCCKWEHLCKFKHNVKKIILIQKTIRQYLHYVYSIYTYLPCAVDNYACVYKINKVSKDEHSVKLIQEHVRFLLYRRRMIRENKVFPKIKSTPSKCTKSVETITDKLFERISRLRIDFDKKTIVFLVSLNNILRRYTGRKLFFRMKYKPRKIFFRVRKIKGEQSKFVYDSSFDEDELLNPINAYKVKQINVDFGEIAEKMSKKNKRKEESGESGKKVNNVVGVNDGDNEGGYCNENVNQHQQLKLRDVTYWSNED